MMQRPRMCRSTVRMMQTQRMCRSTLKISGFRRPGALISANEGIGLARLEFVINNAIGVHPKALLGYDDMDAETKALIDQRMVGYSSPKDFYINKIAEGVATLAASVYPKRIICRLSDFKSNEYKSLIGGPEYEPDEENPMIGFRGAGRYADPAFKDCFAMELEAIKQVRGEM